MIVPRSDVSVWFGVILCGAMVRTVQRIKTTIKVVIAERRSEGVRVSWLCKLEGGADTGSLPRWGDSAGEVQVAPARGRAGRAG